ncbi:hypothetical protein EDD86DRAFT_76686 [Gorgonomyces haynaldii]|nr:hypothetical protein EDD86DRAFT_76686 [Gorgonomyces haynaldii]
MDRKQVRSIYISSMDCFGLWQKHSVCEIAVAIICPTKDPAAPGPKVPDLTCQTRATTPAPLVVALCVCVTLGKKVFPSLALMSSNTVDNSTGASYYLYPSAIFHGLAVHELTQCVMQLVSKLIQDRNAYKMPIFYVSVLAVIANIINLVGFMATLQFLITPSGRTYTDPYYMRLLTMCVFTVQIPMILNHAVILLRTISFHKLKSKEFIGISLFAIVHLLAAVVSMVFGFLSTRRTDFYNDKQYYPAFVLFGGVAIFADACINIVSSILFIFTIGNALHVPRKELFYEMMMNNHGFRWVLVVLVNTYVLFSVLYTVISTTGGNNYIATAYHVLPFSNFLILFCFLQVSYQAARDLVIKHTMATGRTSSGRGSYLQ